MKELSLKYGANPNQKPARIFAKDGELPVTVLNGNPGYINFLDALNGWQLVSELKATLHLPAATSFKHVSPAGAAVGLPLSDVLRKIYFVPETLELSPLACAYARARGTDRMSSFGDWIALSDPCDKATALLIKSEVSDGIIAPGYAEDALEILQKKRGGNYNIVQIDPAYRPAAVEQRDVYGVTFEQGRNEFLIDASLLSRIVTKKDVFSADQQRDLLLSLITLKYTQSNSVCYAKDGQTIGVGAGQQSRIHCTRLAGDKADIWHLRQHERVLALSFQKGLGRADRDNAIDVFISNNAEAVCGDDVWQNYFTVRPLPLSAQEKRAYLDQIQDVCLGSDAFFPFGDNILRAKQSGVVAVVQPGGSIRDDNVIEMCDAHGIAMAFCGMRLFHH